MEQEGQKGQGAFTPGPWGIEQTRDMLWVGPLRPDSHKVDDVVVGLNIDRELTMTAALRQHRNALLIAGAPDLLAALIDLAEHASLQQVAIKNGGSLVPFDVPGKIDNAKAAILKATRGSL